MTKTKKGQPETRPSTVLRPLPCGFSVPVEETFSEGFPVAPSAPCTRIVGTIKIGGMRTYSHALLTWAVARRLVPSEPGVAAWGAAGAVLPDLPAVAAAVWLLAWRKRTFSREEFCREACEKGSFGGPDAALHSALSVVALLALYGAFGAKKGDSRGKMSAFLLGWGGHVLVDALTHSGDARPIFWPISGWRPEGPISYWDRTRHSRPFTLAEHAAVLAVAVWILRQKPRRRDRRC